MSPGEIHSVTAVVDLQPGQHLCSLYQSEEEHRALLTSFLRQGLQRGEKVLYFLHAHPPEAVRDYLRQDGVDLAAYLAQGQLAFLNTADVYLGKGDFDPDRMIALLAAETEKALAEGYPALRVTGEMTWALEGAPGAERLLEYEAKLNRFFPGSRCVALCQYDRRRFSPGLLLGVLQTHPMAVVGTTLYPNNFYFVPPDDFLGENTPAALLEQYLKNLAERQSLDDELRRSRAQLERRVEARTRELSLANQALQAEIAARQRALESLRVAEEKFRRLVESAPDAMVVVDRAGRVVLVNAQAETLFGYQRVELLGQPLERLIPERFRVRHADGCRRFFDQGESRPMSGGHEHAVLRKDGIEFPIEVGLSPLETEDGRMVLSIIRDVSERKRAEEALRRSETSLAEAQRIAHLGSWEWDIVTNELFWSDEVYRIFGLAPQAFGATYEAFLERVHPDDRELVAQGVEAALRRRLPYSVLHRVVRPDGSVRVVHERGEVSFDADGRPLRMVGTVLDVTERQRAEVALASSEARYRGLFEDSPVTLWEEDFSAAKPLLDSLRAQGITDFDSYFQGHPEALRRCAEGVKVVDVNRAALELFEAPGKDALRGSLAAVFTQESLSAFQQELVALADGRTSVETETVARTLTGEVRNLAVKWILAPGYEETFARVLVSVVDTTERKTLEEQLRQAQKMEAVGRLAAGVAHDFNNLLNVVLGYSDLLGARLGADLKLQDMVSEIRKAAERATNLTRQLLAFGRKQVLQPRVLNLNDVVTETEKMLRRLIGEDIELVSKLQPALGKVKADPSQIEQVILNLAVNARDAMPTGGQLTIETANVDLDKAYAHTHAGIQPGAYVLLAVSDTGCGMDEDTRAHLFEPFFTSKEKGKGTGLGLATVYGIVRQSGGWIWVYSEPGHGTTFKIYLPRTKGPVEPGRVPLPVEEVAAPAGEKKTVLLVEDERPLRVLVRQFLEELGYAVLDADSAVDAVRLVEQHPAPIHLLVTDVIMPGSSGRTLADHLATLRPETKVLYMSGYPDETIVHHGVLAPGMEFLQKPFTLDTLGRKLRSMLTGQAAQPTA